MREHRFHPPQFPILLPSGVLPLIPDLILFAVLGPPVSTLFQSYAPLAQLLELVSVSCVYATNLLLGLF